MTEKNLDNATHEDFEEMERNHERFMEDYWRQQCRKTGWPVELILGVDDGE